MALVLTNTARNWIVNKLGAVGGASFSSSSFFIGVGNGGGQLALNSDTSLASEISGSRSVATVVVSSTNVTGDGLTFQITYAPTISFGSSLVFDNIGVFDAVSAGNLFLHVNIPAVTMHQNDTVVLQFTLVF